jgi:osmotically-inducible protein OsmY
MQLLKVFTIVIALSVSTGCTTILVEATGPEGLQEDPGKRTTGARVEDQSIETKIVVNMKSQEPAFRNANFDVISHNGVVLLIGQVQSEELKQRATEIASQASAKIKRIHNELEVSGKTGLLARSNDAWISTKVRAQLLADDAVPSDQVRVITENGSVYLMGMVNQQEGDNAAALARNISGVTRVVKVFEYLN